MRKQRSLLGLLIAVVTAVIVWWTQGDGQAPDSQAQPRETPSVQVTTAAPSDEPTSEPGEPSGEPSVSPSESDSPTGSSEPTEDTGGDGGTDPESGLPIVQVADLPPEAAETLELIDSGGPFPYDRDGITFENREGILPDHPEGYYREYTVETPGEDDRGARRIVTGDGGEYYWTDDHYASFSRIAR